MIHNIKLDHAEKIYYLTLIIKNLCEENDLTKAVIIDDFIYLMMGGEEDD